MLRIQKPFFQPTRMKKEKKNLPPLLPLSHPTYFSTLSSLSLSFPVGSDSISSFVSSSPSSPLPSRVEVKTARRGGGGGEGRCLQFMKEKKNSSW